MSSFDQLEAAAEAIVFAHEPDGNSEWFDDNDRDIRRLERVAALATAAIGRAEPVPVGLQQRLAAAGLEFCAARAAAPEPVGVNQPRALSPVRAPSVPALPRRGWSMFVLGIAAIALVWFALGFGRGEPTPTEQRLALLSQPSVMRLAWKAGPSPKSGAVSGDVVWDETSQQGFLTFKGLPPLDDEHRFQLWIVDGKREGAPVDGGLFAITKAGEPTVVPITARLPVGEAAAFVVTVEEKAGAVVSGQEHVVAIAAR